MQSRLSGSNYQIATASQIFKIFRADFEIGASRLVIDEMDSADRDMFRAAIHGDREAFEMIIRTMSRPLFAIAFGILQNREEAEDVVQDAFVKAWKSRWRVREPERLQGWIPRSRAIGLTTFCGDAGPCRWTNS